ncbi:transcriptional regulator, LysR family protein, partial [Oceanicola granulosus HTCC2516]
MLYLTLRQYEYIAAVARAGSLAAAAQQMNVSQPSLSTALTQVEARLGRRLFHRGRGQPVRLTATGEAYLAEIERMLALARRLEDPSGLGPAPAERLTLGLFDDLAPFHLCPLVAALREGLPGVEIRHRTANFAELAREVLDGRVELALSYDLGLDGSFARTPLFGARPCAFLPASDPLARRAGLTLADLAGRPLILFDEPLSVRHVLGLFRRIGARPEVRHRVGALELMRSLAASGAGVGISYAVPPGGATYDGQTLAAVPVTDAIAEEPVVLVQSAMADESPLVARAREILTDRLATRE